MMFHDDQLLLVICNKIEIIISFILLSRGVPGIGMGLLHVLLLVLIQEHGLAQHVIGGDGGNDCCLFVTVNVGGVNADLDGEYNLKTKEDLKPEEPCLNGCIYTKAGSPSTEEYCFKKDNEAGADVQCPVRKTTFY